MPKPIWKSGLISQSMKGKDRVMKKKKAIKDIVVLLIAVFALVCAAINLNNSLNLLAEPDEE